MMSLNKGRFMMKSSLQNIRLDIQYVTDEQGKRIFVQIPFAQWEMIRPEIIEADGTANTTESPELVDKQGILVVRATSFRDVTNITRYERNRRVSELLQKGGV
jgi:hypothetical protein